MKTNTLRQDVLRNDPASELPDGWDALKVWREHVRNAPVATATSAPSQGWDPYLVWLTRVKRG